MAMTPAIDITAEQRRTVLALLNRHLPDTTTWAYGSRVKWTSRPESDLDLVVFARPEQSARVAELREAFEESDLPFRVDLFVWDEVPENSKRRIKAERAELTSAGGRTRIAANRSKQDNGWTAIQLGNMCKKIGSGMTPRGGSKVYLDRGSYALIRSQNIHNNGFRRDGLAFIDEQQAKNLKNAEVQPHDVLLNITGDSVARCCQVSPELLPARVNQHVAIIRPDPDILDPRFLRYALVEPKMQDRMLSWAGSGATRNALTKEMIESFEMFAPRRVQEQRDIAHILGALDDKIELNRRMNETLEAMARALFKSWFVEFDPVRAKMEGRDPGLPKSLANLFPNKLAESEFGLIPEGWDVGTLGDIASLNSESWSARNPPEDIIYVDLANTKWGHIEKVETYSWIKAPSRARRVLRPGDTIVSTVRPGNGSFALIGRDGLTGSTGFAVLRPKAVDDREIVWCAATSRDNIDRLAHLADGGAYPAVRPQIVTGTPVALADFPVKRAFSAMVAPWLDRIEYNRRESRKLASLRNTLLPVLVSGELRMRPSHT